VAPRGIQPERPERRKKGSKKKSDMKPLPNTQPPVLTAIAKKRASAKAVEEEFLAEKPFKTGSKEGEREESKCTWLTTRVSGLC
jgi:hypothetical protein